TPRRISPSVITLRKVASSGTASSQSTTNGLGADLVHSDMTLVSRSTLIARGHEVRPGHVRLRGRNRQAGTSRRTRRATRRGGCGAPLLGWPRPPPPLDRDGLSSVGPRTAPVQ